MAATSCIPSTTETLRVLSSFSARAATYEKQFAITLVTPPKMPETIQMECLNF